MQQLGKPVHADEALDDSFSLGHASVCWALEWRYGVQTALSVVLPPWPKQTLARISVPIFRFFVII
jgi:hypothetical protein